MIHPPQKIFFQSAKKMKREQQCWEETSLEHLRKRGIHTGLTDYLHEIEQRLTPIIGAE